MNKHRPISCSSDKTIRLWKMIDETHLVFRGHKGAVDTVRMLTKDSFISGGQDGSLLLWKETQKRPVASILTAHGLEGDDENLLGQRYCTVPRWICSLTTIHSSDLVVSGSYDGNIKFWSAKPEGKDLKFVNNLKLPGFVNSMAISSSCRLLVAGTGNEHRMGRWWRLPGNHNKVVVMKLPNLEDMEGENELENEFNNYGDSADNDMNSDDHDDDSVGSNVSDSDPFFKNDNKKI